MILRELFDKEFLYESKKENKMNKIFYKFDIKVVKKKEEEKPEEPAQDQQSQQPPAEEPAQDQGGEQPQDQGMEPQPTADLSMDQGQQPMDQGGGMEEPPAPMDDPFANMPTASVVTEDEKAIEINDDNNIVRKLEGEVLLPKEEIDNIQTIEDLITKLTETKVEGVNVLDEFTADIIQVLADQNQQKQIAEMIDKKSAIFAEILYGKRKEESVGIRIIKRKNSDMVTTSMLIDNKIINAPYNKQTVDERIVAVRNDEYTTEEK